MHVTVTRQSHKLLIVGLLNWKTVNISDMKTEIKKLRVKIDGLAQLATGLEPVSSCGIIGCEECEPGNSREIEKSVDSLYLAKAWLGKILGELGEDTPYGNDGKRKGIEDIEPVADQWHGWFDSPESKNEWEDKSHVEKVDWLRQELQKIIDVDILCVCNDLLDVKPKFPDSDLNHSENRTDLFIRNVYSYLSEARFWIGFELQRIKESE